MANPFQGWYGEPFCYIGGKNHNHTGWLDNGRQHCDANMIYILVDMGEGNVCAMWALKKNIGPIWSVNATYWEAVLAGFPDIELKINKLAYSLAKCCLPSYQPAGHHIEGQYNECIHMIEEVGGRARVQNIVHHPGATQKRAAEGEPKRGDKMDEETILQADAAIW